MVKVEHEEIDVEESATWTVMIVGGRADGVGVLKGSVGERAWSNMSGGHWDRGWHLPRAACRVDVRCS